MSFKRVSRATIGLLLVCFIFFGLASLVQELFVTTVIPNTVSGEVSNRSFAFALGAAFVIVIQQLGEWCEERTKKRAHSANR